MQPAGRLKAEIDIVRSPIAKDVSRDMEDLGAANTMLHPHPDARNRLIGRFFFRSQLALARTFLGLLGSHVRWFVALKARIFVELAARWEAIVFFIGGALVAG